MRRLSVLAVALLTLAAPVYAQTETAPAVGQLFAANDRPHVDLAVGFTALGETPGHPRLHAGDQITAIQLRGGGYWTRHLKTAVEWTTTAEYLFDYASEYVKYPNYVDSVRMSHVELFDRFSLAQVYEFRPGTAWRPYVGAGVGVDIARFWDERNDDLTTGISGGDPVDRFPQANALPRSTTTTVRGIGTAGFKLYWGARLGGFLMVEVQGGTGHNRLSTLRVAFGHDLF